MRAALYARVSTVNHDQDPETQMIQLRDYIGKNGHTSAGEYVDRVSGSKERRPELDRMLDAIKRQEIDMVIVWRLDRLGRSLKHLVELLEFFDKSNVQFVSMNEALDTTTPMGKLMFHMTGAFAEYQRGMIRENVLAGLARANGEGRYGGRRRVATDDALLYSLRGKGWTLNQLANEFDVCISTVANRLKEQRLASST